MWKRILNSDLFLLNINYSKVFVTNYVSIWFIHFSDETFITCLKNSNFGLEMPKKEMIDKGKCLISNPSNLTTVKENKDGSTLVLTLIKSFGYPFKLQLKLTEGSKELFFQQITQPLLQTVENLRCSETELKRLLVKKDQEIEEYKCEGGAIALRHLKTIPFNDEAHTLKYTNFLENFGADDIPGFLLNKNIDVPEDRIKLEPTQINGTSSPIVKEELKSEIKEETQITNASPNAPMKSESDTQPMQTLVKTESLSQQYTTGVSPSKRQRRKLNL